METLSSSRQRSVSETMATKSVEAQMKELLDTFDHHVQEVVEDAAKESAKECVQKLKDTSPKRPGGGEYARSWTSKKLEHGWVVYNKKHYRLTHLLENGHVSANQFGEYGVRFNGIKHIAPVEEEGIEGFELRINRGINE